MLGTKWLAEHLIIAFFYISFSDAGTAATCGVDTDNE